MIPPNIGGDASMQSQRVQTRVVSFILPEPKELPGVGDNGIRIPPEQMDQLRKSGKLELLIHPTLLKQPVAFLKPAGVFALDTSALSTLEITLNQGSSSPLTLSVKDPRNVLSAIEGILLVTDISLMNPEMMVPAPEAPAPETAPSPDPSASPVAKIHSGQRAPAKQVLDHRVHH